MVTGDIAARGPALGAAGAREPLAAVRTSVLRLASTGRLETMRRAPVLTGRFRASLAYEVRATATGAEARIFSRDTPGKVRVIEFGFPAKRPDLRGRAPRLVFTETATTLERLVRTEGLALTVDIVRRLAA